MLTTDPGRVHVAPIRVLVISGIYPPDIGGPATHAADLVAELRERGHQVFVLSLTEERERVRNADSVRFPRHWVWPLRMLAGVAWMISERRTYDVVYATGLGPMAVWSGRLLRRPVVLKVVADPAWERGHRLGLAGAAGVPFDEFTRSDEGGLRLRAMKTLRNRTAGAASRVVVPSESLRPPVQSWLPSGRNGGVVVVPNGARAQPTPATYSHERDLAAIMVCRLVDVKRVDKVLGAVADTPGVRLDVVGDGPERDKLVGLAERLGLGDRARFEGALAHNEVVERISRADLLVMASSHEGLPHSVLEALACGTPVVSTPAGGISDVIVDGDNGLIVDTADEAVTASLANALARLRDDPRLVARLAQSAAVSGERWRFAHTADRIEALLAEVQEGRRRPLTVTVAKSRVDRGSESAVRAKYAIHDLHLRQVVIGSGRPAIRRVGDTTLVALPIIRPWAVGGPAFYLAAPLLGVVLAATVGGRGSVVACQSPFEALATLFWRRLVPRGRRPLLQIELHGDWRTAARLYGHPARRLLGPVADRLATFALRRADRVRVVSELLGELARDAGYDGEMDRFVTFSGFSTFFDPPIAPLPTTPFALFAGVLERYKAVEVLLEAWVEVTAAIDDARLILVGAGGLEAEVRARLAQPDLRGTVELLAPVDHERLSQMMDESTCLVLPSRSEGLARIVIEAMARSRPVVATAVGGIAEVLDDGVNGLLVPADDASGLASALIKVLRDPDLAASMGAKAREKAAARNPLAEYKAGIARQAEWAKRRASEPARSR